MKRALTLLAVGLGLATTTNAQMLPVGSIAPNWTYNDINNQSHTLYNYLDSGYTVIMDISAAWCGPCWAVHNSHVFDSLTKHYGVNGTISPRKIKFFFFEGENTNTTAQLYGTGTTPPASYADGTQGNWVAGTNYTILDQSAIKNAYPIGGFPTFYVICPNREVSFTESGYTQAMLSEPFWVNYMQACPVATQPTDAAIAGVVTDMNVCAGTAVTLSTNLQNMGTSTMTSATVKALVNNTVVATQNWTGSLTKYGIAAINFPSYTPTGSGTLKYEVTQTGDANAANNSKTGAINSFGITQNNIRVEVRTDNYPTELTWRLKNGNTVIAQQTYTGPGAGGGPNANTVFTYDYPSLPLNACIVLEVEDAYGDGLNNGTASTADDGYVKITDLANNQVLFNIAGASYEVDATRRFKVGSTAGIEDVVEVNSITLTPNPTTGNSAVNMNLVKSGVASLQVVDMTGRVVYTFAAQKMNAGRHQLSIPSAQFAAGTYQVNLMIDGGAMTQRLTVVK